MDPGSFDLDSARGASQLRPIFYPSPEEFRPNGIDRPVKMGGGEIKKKYCNSIYAKSIFSVPTTH